MGNDLLFCVTAVVGGCFEITLAIQSAKLGPLNLIPYYLEILEGATFSTRGFKILDFE